MDDLAWVRSDAIEVIKALDLSTVAILGGDVLSKENSIYKYNYDNWHSEIKPGEQWAEYAARSRKEAKEYLNRYPDPEDRTYIYSLVFSDKPDTDQLRHIYMSANISLHGIGGKLLRLPMTSGVPPPVVDQNALAKWVLEELEAERKWELMFAESEDVLDKLADEALSAHKKGKTKPLDIPILIHKNNEGRVPINR